ncbi:hypothetical protein V2J09_001673 [Rumex salicifolius]
MPRTSHCSLIVILLKSMACFFRCFGVRYSDRRNLVSSSDAPVSTPVEPVVLRNQNLSSLFLSEGSENVVAKERDSHVRPAVETEFDDLELKDEAKFLKACGTLQQTPDEIRKLPKKLKDLQDSEFKYHSWLPNISASELVENDLLSDQLSAPDRLNEEDTKFAAVASPTPHSIINEQSDVLISISALEDEIADDTNTTTNRQVDGKSDATIMSISPAPAASKSEFLNRSVRFTSPTLSSESSPRTCIQQREKPELKDNGSMSKHSPYPTPLNLTHDMQTPGTVFASATNGQVRSQYVYTSMNTSESIDHSSVSLGVSNGPPQNANSETSLSESSVKGYFTAGDDLSSWIKTPALDGGGNERKYRPGGNQEDRPILGLVAEHWKEEDVSRISPKEWDGNGIPNTTTKYKEDQKVHWHATPFVERLEKALSEETFISRRNPAILEAVAFTDEEERDTASCKLQSLQPSKPMASY